MLAVDTKTAYEDAGAMEHHVSSETTCAINFHLNSATLFYVKINSKCNLIDPIIHATINK